MRISLLPLPLLVMAASLVNAAELTGRQVAERTEQNNQGYGSQRVLAEMTLTDPSGKPTVSYKLQQFVKEGSNDQGAKALIRFVAPADTKGTALLIHESLTKEDDRWLYLSDVRQLKRIAGSNKSASFKGSEMSYEDLTISVLDRYDWKLLGEKTFEGRPTYEVERTPRFEASGYSRSVVLIDKENFYPVKMDYYDRAGQLLKTAHFKDYRQYKGKWRSHLIEVSNLQTKRGTSLSMSNFSLGDDLPDSLFTKSQLQK